MKIEVLELCCHHMHGMIMNCYLVSTGEDATEVLVIDPGAEPERILAAAGERRIATIACTHSHSDHIGALSRLKQATGAEVLVFDGAEAADFDEARPYDTVVGDNGEKGEKGEKGSPKSVVDVLLNDGDLVFYGSWDGLETDADAPVLRVLHTPGHTPGSMCLYSERDGVLISGDTLFRNSCGRTDFAGGSVTQMRESLRRLATLPDEVVVYPGHDEATTIGWEKRFGVLHEFAV